MRTFVIFLYLTYGMAITIILTVITILIKALVSKAIAPGWLRAGIFIVLIVLSVPPYKWMISPFTSQGKKFLALGVSVAFKISAIFTLCHPLSKCP